MRTSSAVPYQFNLVSNNITIKTTSTYSKRLVNWRRRRLTRLMSAPGLEIVAVGLVGLQDHVLRLDRPDAILDGLKRG